MNPQPRIHANAEDVEPALLCLRTPAGQVAAKGTPPSKLRLCYPNTVRKSVEPLVLTLSGTMRKGLEMYSGGGFKVKTSEAYIHGESAFQKVAQAKLTGRMDVPKEQLETLMAIDDLVHSAVDPSMVYNGLVNMFGGVNLVTRAHVHDKDGKRVEVDDAKKRGARWVLEGCQVRDDRSGVLAADPFKAMSEGYEVTKGTFVVDVSEYQGKVTVALEMSSIRGHECVYVPPPPVPLPHADEVDADSRVPKKQRTA